MTTQHVQVIRVQGLEKSYKTPNATRWNTPCQGGVRAVAGQTLGVVA
jgi:hypothetical protein